MGLREKYRSSRTREVEVAGITFKLRPPDTRMAILRAGLEPSAMRKAMISSAKAKAGLLDNLPKDQLIAQHEDFIDFVRALLAESCESPKLYLPFEQLPENDPDAMYVTDLMAPDLDLLSTEVLKLLKTTKEVVARVAPFPDSSDTREAGQPVGNAS